MSARSGPARALVPGWNELRHAGLLLDGPRLHSLSSHVPGQLDEHVERRLRRRAATLLAGLEDDAGSAGVSEFVSFVLEEVCGFTPDSGDWLRGSRLPGSWGRRSVTGETVKPRHLWSGPRGAVLPVFIDDAKRIGIGRGRRGVSRVLGWLRAGSEHLALVTNGRQWRLVFAGLDYDASCEWDAELWLEEGEVGPQVTVLRTLLRPELWTPAEEGVAPQLLQAIRETRKGQADLSEVLGERLREAVEILVRSHGELLRELADGDEAVSPADIYRAACRMAMRAVVVLFAESRDLLPRSNTVYHEGYGLNGLFGQLERRAARGDAMGEAFGAWPRILSLFRLVSEGSHHPDLPVTAYGGELFAPGRADARDGVSRTLHVFETACFRSDVLADREVYSMLRLLTRTKAKIRQGQGGMWVTVPVDFSDLSSEYIGIVYEGLLDYELKTAPDGDPVVFLAVGDRPALPLSRLEEMDDKALRGLFEKLRKDTSGDEPEVDEDEAAPPDEAQTAEDVPDEAASTPEDDADMRRSNRTRAERWARRAAEVAGLVRTPPGRITPERRLAHERKVGETARKLVNEVVLPGEWYLARWGGTRKGSGSFYTRPGLAVPTVHRTLRPLAYDPPAGLPPDEARHAPPSEWTPKRPEDILAVNVCDPACGSGSFVLAALRFLTEALYESVRRHGRIEPDGERSLVRLLGMRGGEGDDHERLSDEQIPCAPDHEDFEPRLKARLRRHVVERCLYAVDMDPLAVELCRLSLWVETMDRELPFGFLDHKVKCGNALVGAWFDQFQHYPAMAWKNREGGDKNHSNGVHFEKNARGKAIKAFHKDRLTPDMKRFLEDPTLFEKDLLEEAATAHEDAIEVLAYMHDLPIHDAAERADVYRRDLLGSNAWRSLKDAMDLWCACWFWPADEIEHAPVPTSFADPAKETRAVARNVAARHCFFHWELEFPDVFREGGTGFDAVVGNPPWDIAKPVSMEFFSNIDPLYRSYGKQEALRRQAEYFKKDEAVERDWLDYCANFRARSNFVGRARNPFGDPEKTDKSQNRIYFGKGNLELHRAWRSARGRTAGFADPQHPFRHQGSADLNLYKLFLETAHALVRKGGRIGFLTPSGLYSDNGTGPLRTLFLQKCRWEWLFGLENSGKIFPIHRSYKFNPVIIEKGGTTEAIRTAFMRRALEDWERAEELGTPYTREQVEQFSPKSRAILEIQSPRDLEILERIYDNSVLLGDDGPDGWGIRYATEFHMTNDSKLFPPRQKWEEKGYRPDEYSRWLEGDWRPVGELWAELGVDPDDPVPVAIELADWLFDTTAGPERREAEARFAHGHLLKPGDVARSEWAVRCAQPPYDGLPVPRVAIPPGIILSRDGTEWIREGRVEDVALPLYEGRMIGQFDFSEKGWVSGKGRGAVWRDIPWDRKQIEPQFLMSAGEYGESRKARRVPKAAYMRISSTTNTRTTISSYLGCYPAGDSVFYFVPQSASIPTAATISAIFSTFAFDWTVRQRLGGLNMSEFVMIETPLPKNDSRLEQVLSLLTAELSFSHPSLVVERLHRRSGSILGPAAVTRRRRCERIAMIDSIAALTMGLGDDEVCHVLEGCDRPRDSIEGGSAKGFWRVDRRVHPELRQTVLTLVAFRDLESKVRAKGDRDRGIHDFLAQNGGAGWLLPETLRLADHGLGHDDRARQHQLVASRLGSRFYDWQLAQSPEEARRECHLHARNLLGHAEYAQLLERLIEHRKLVGDDHHDLLLGGFTRDLVRHHQAASQPEASAADAGGGAGPELDARSPDLLKVAERGPGYVASTVLPQTDMFPQRQKDLFE